MTEKIVLLLPVLSPTAVWAHSGHGAWGVFHHGDAILILLAAITAIGFGVTTYRRRHQA